MSIKINIYLFLYRTITYIIYSMTFFQPSHLPSTPELNEENHQRPASLEIRGEFPIILKIDSLLTEISFQTSPLIKLSPVLFHQE